MGVRADSNRSSNGQTQTMSFVVGVPTLRRIRWTSTTHSHLHSRTKRLWPFWFSPLHTWRLAHTRSPHSSHLINYFPHHWSVILAWRPQGTEELPLRDLAPPLQLALQSQLDTGWYTLLCGFVTKHFESIQTEYYQQLGKRNSGSTDWKIVANHTLHEVPLEWSPARITQHHQLQTTRPRSVTYSSSSRASTRPRPTCTPLPRLLLWQCHHPPFQACRLY